MDVLLVDDGVPFDGLTPSSQPLGGAEKAFASLPAALKARGHTVRVINRCANPVTADGVSWQKWDAPRPQRCDVLIAYRRPELLDFPVAAGRRILWLAMPAGYLARADNAAILGRHAEAPVVVWSEAHRATCPPALTDRVRVIAPGVGRAYLEDAPMAPATPPRALVTSHPRMGLDWVVRMWRDHVRPAVTGAELHVYSALLSRGADGGAIPEALTPVLEAVRAARGDGVVVLRPLGDPGMADAYRAARAHLYPGSEDEVHCHTLAESQAVGLPGIARRRPAASACLVDGETGFVVPDAEAFASCAILLLSEDAIFTARSAAARARRRDWDAAAAEFEALFP